MEIPIVPGAVIKQITKDYSTRISCGLQFPASFIIDFACRKLAKKVTNEDHMTVGHCNVIIESWVLSA